VPFADLRTDGEPGSHALSYHRQGQGLGFRVQGLEFRVEG
jgi:hypothetical protein